MGLTMDYKRVIPTVFFVARRLIRLYNDNIRRGECISGDHDWEMITSSYVKRPGTLWPYSRHVAFMCKNTKFVVGEYDKLKADVNKFSEAVICGSAWCNRGWCVVCGHSIYDHDIDCPMAECLVVNKKENDAICSED
jgi:hypothetical protein